MFLNREFSVESGALRICVQRPWTESCISRYPVNKHLDFGLDHQASNLEFSASHFVISAMPFCVPLDSEVLACKTSSLCVEVMHAIKFNRVYWESLLGSIRCFNYRPFLQTWTNEVKKKPTRQIELGQMTKDG